MSFCGSRFLLEYRPLNKPQQSSVLNPEHPKVSATRFASIGVMIKMATSNLPIGIVFVSRWYRSYFLMTKVVGIQIIRVTKIGIRNW